MEGGALERRAGASRWGRGGRDSSQHGASTRELDAMGVLRRRRRLLLSRSRALPSGVVAVAGGRVERRRACSQDGTKGEGWGQRYWTQAELQPTHKEEPRGRAEKWSPANHGPGMAPPDHPPDNNRGRTVDGGLGVTEPTADIAAAALLSKKAASAPSREARNKWYCSVLEMGPAAGPPSDNGRLSCTPRDESDSACRHCQPRKLTHRAAITGSMVDRVVSLLCRTTATPPSGMRQPATAGGSAGMAPSLSIRVFCSLALPCAHTPKHRQRRWSTSRHTAKPAAAAFCFECAQSRAVRPRYCGGRSNPRRPSQRASLVWRFPRWEPMATQMATRRAALWPVSGRQERQAGAGSAWPHPKRTLGTPAPRTTSRRLIRPSTRS